MTYNGWKNRATWNVALWIGNNPELYNLAKACKYGLKPYLTLVGILGSSNDGSPLMTPDGTNWNDPSLDIEALNRMMREL